MLVKNKIINKRKVKEIKIYTYSYDHCKPEEESYHPHAGKKMIKILF